MSEKKKATVFSNSIGNAWHGETTPDQRRKMDTDKSKKGKK